MSVLPLAFWVAAVVTMIARAMRFEGACRPRCHLDERDLPPRLSGGLKQATLPSPNTSPSLV